METGMISYKGSLPDRQDQSNNERKKKNNKKNDLTSLVMPQGQKLRPHIAVGLPASCCLPGLD
jgi:hypothetical protein